MYNLITEIWTSGSFSSNKSGHNFLCYHGATAVVGQGLLIIEDSRLYSDTPQSIGLLWASISQTQRPLPDNTQHLYETDVYAFVGIRTRNPSRRTTTDPRLRPCGHWDRPGPSWRHTICERIEVELRVRASFSSRRHTLADCGSNLALLQRVTGEKRPESEINRHNTSVQVPKLRIRGSKPPRPHGIKT